MIYPLVRDLAAPDAPVAVTCRVLGFSTQALYQWKRAPVSARDWDDAQVPNAAVDVHADDPEFGYRLTADELRHAGHQVSENRVHRLCPQQRLWSAHTRNVA
jgi:putative transposase